LPALAWRLLNGDAEAIGRYSSRSEAEGAICASLANAGLDFDAVLALFQSMPGPGKFRELYAENPKAGLRYLRHTWESAVNWTAAHIGPAVELAQRLATWAEARPWPGRTGATDRAVYLAAVAIVARCGRNPAGMASRELSELGGTTWQTSSHALARLCVAGLLERVRPAAVTLPAVYRIVAPTDDGLYLSLPHRGVSERVTKEVHDLWRRAGLGLAGQDVWRVLQAGATTAAAIARQTGRAARTVARKLRAMFRLGLAEPLGDGVWRAVDGADLDAAAVALGTAGLGGRQREAHRRQREAQRATWRAWREGR
jgi:hypothetical protein